MTLALGGHDIPTYFDAYQREDPDGAISFALAQLVQKLLAKKTPLFSSATILTFLTPGRDVIFDLTYN